MINPEVEEMLRVRTKSKDICEKLNTHERRWRREVKKYNRGYAQRERIITSNRHGYILTTDPKLIRKYAFSLIHHAVSELNDAKEILKIESQKGNISLLPEEQQLVDVVMKFGDMDGK